MVFQFYPIMLSLSSWPFVEVYIDLHGVQDIATITSIHDCCISSSLLSLPKLLIWEVGCFIKRHYNGNNQRVGGTKQKYLPDCPFILFYINAPISWSLVSFLILWVFWSIRLSHGTGQTCAQTSNLRNYSCCCFFLLQENAWHCPECIIQCKVRRCYVVITVVGRCFIIKCVSLLNL